MPDITQKAGPAFLLGKRFAAHELNDRSIAPQGSGVREVIHGVAAEPQSLGLDHGNAG
jgi:hypothetical protein